MHLHIFSSVEGVIISINPSSIATNMALTPNNHVGDAHKTNTYNTNDCGEVYKVVLLNRDYYPVKTLRYTNNLASAKRQRTLSAKIGINIGIHVN